MEPVNIRLYYGGVFVTKNRKTEYVRNPNAPSNKWGLALKLNVDEVCFFEFAYWIKNELGFEEVGEIWFRKKGCSLFNGRALISDDKDIPKFLEAPEEDGFYHLYVVHPPRKPDNGWRHAPWISFYNEKERFGSDFNVSGSLGSFIDDGESSDLNNVEFESANHMSCTSGEKESYVHKEGGPQIQIHPNNHTSNPNIHNTTDNTASSTLQVTSPPQIATTIPQKPKPSTHPPYRPKLPIRQPHKRPLTAGVVEGSLEKEDLQGNELNDSTDESSDPDYSEAEESEAELSDDDIDNQEDDDLFNKYVDKEIIDNVKESLKGLTQIAAEEEDLEVTGVDLADDAVLDDSDDDNLSDVGSDEDGVKYPEFNPRLDFKGNINLSKGLIFPSNKVFRKAVQWHAVEKGYNYYFLHNSNTRVSVYCAKRCGCLWKHGRIMQCVCGSKNKCRFKVHCRKLKNELSWQIKSLRLTHICEHQTKNPKCTSQYLAERYLEDWRDDPTWKIKAFIKRVRRELGIEVGYYKAYYARVRALKMIFGDATLEYARVWDYAATVIKYNPGSTCVVKVDSQEGEQPLFQRLYVCFQSCKEGFISGCRPILGVDGAHLKGPYPGILLTAVGKDGNNNIFPVAWAVVEVENSETWAWFLELVRADIASVAESVTWVHEQDELTYMSDRQKAS